MQAPRKRKSESLEGGAELSLTEDQDAILLAAEQQAQGLEVESLDISSLKKLVLNFERKLTKNQQMRVKFPDQPDKFMESELELYEEIQKLQLLSTNPDLYPEFVRLGCVQSLLNLLTHENTDIGNAAIGVLQELTDSDAVGESEDIVPFIDTLLQHNMLELLVQNLSKLNESQAEDFQAVHNSLAIIENIIELKPDIAIEITTRTDILGYLLGKISSRTGFDQNKLYACEILAILLQSNPENQKKFGDKDGVNSMLESIAPYRKHDAKGGDEVEFVENMFDILCSALTLPENQTKFLEAEGIQLLLIIIKKRTKCWKSAVKLLDFALLQNKAGCMKFVDELGLKTLFPLFMGKGITKTKKGSSEEMNIEEHIISLVMSLLSLCDGANLERVYGKFSESEFEKVDRLIEYHESYHAKVKKADSKFALKLADGEELDNDDLYLDRLDAGLYVLQQIDVILGKICGIEQIKTRVHQQLDQLNIDKKVFKSVIQEYALNLGDESAKELRDEIAKLATHFESE